MNISNLSLEITLVNIERVNKWSMKGINIESLCCLFVRKEVRNNG